MDNNNILQEKEWVRDILIPKIVENGTLLSEDTSSREINKDKFVLRDITIKFLSTQEAFMLTKCYRAKIDYEYNGIQKSTTLVVKKTPQLTKESYEAVNFDALFHNEILAYTKIIPDIFESKKYAKYYYSHRKELEAVIVLGDFSLDGWKMTKSKYNLSLEHVLLAAQSIGNFHGSGFALKHKNFEKFQQIINSVKESRYNGEISGDWLIITTTSSQRAIEAAKTFKYSKTMIPQEFLEKLKELIGHPHKYCERCSKPTEPLSTICHGDYLRNNVAYKYEDQQDSDKPTDIFLFDFQTLRYSTPMIDLTTFLSVSCGRDIRSTNFEKIFSTYWSSLAQIFCDKTGIELKNLPAYLRKDSMLKEYIRCLPYGLGIASWFLMAIVDPYNYNTEEMLDGMNRPHDEVVKDTFTRGGDIVNKELSALVHELYELSTKYNVDIFEGFLKKE